MQHLFTRYRHYMTIQSGTVVLAFVIALGWIWGTVETLQKNFTYQQEVDLLSETVELETIRNENLQFQQQYYRSAEFLELSARQRLGKASPGEKLIILPDTRDVVDPLSKNDAAPQTLRGSNLSQWTEFFFGEKPSS